MANPKRDEIAALIEEGGATKESLMEAVAVSSAGLSSQFTYLRLTGRYPIQGDDGIYKFISEEEWTFKKNEAASRKINGESKKSPEERKEALEKRVAKLQGASEKADGKAKEEKSELNKLKQKKADAELKIAELQLTEVNAEVASDDTQGEEESLG